MLDTIKPHFGIQIYLGDINLKYDNEVSCRTCAFYGVKIAKISLTDYRVIGFYHYCAVCTN